MTKTNRDASENPFERASRHLAENEVASLIKEHLSGGIADEPRTIHGRFPGSKTRAMGHALEVIEWCEEDGVEAEREYIEPVEDLNLHRIDIHIQGGSDE